MDEKLAFFTNILAIMVFGVIVVLHFVSALAGQKVFSLFLCQKSYFSRLFLPFFPKMYWEELVLNSVQAPFFCGPKAWEVMNSLDLSFQLAKVPAIFVNPQVASVSKLFHSWRLHQILHVTKKHCGNMLTRGVFHQHKTLW